MVHRGRRGGGGRGRARRIPPAATGFPFALLTQLIPITAGVAILRYRLYDIDLVLSKTLVFALLAAFITIVYVSSSRRSA